MPMTKKQRRIYKAFLKQRKAELAEKAKKK